VRAREKRQRRVPKIVFANGKTIRVTSNHKWDIAADRRTDRYEREGAGRRGDRQSARQKTDQ
jgi:hypothetical protein